MFYTSCTSQRARQKSYKNKRSLEKSKTFNDEYIHKQIYTIAKWSKKSNMKVIDQCINGLQQEKIKLSKSRKADKKESNNCSILASSSINSDEEQNKPVRATSHRNFECLASTVQILHQKKKDQTRSLIDHSIRMDICPQR